MSHTLPVPISLYKFRAVAIVMQSKWRDSLTRVLVHCTVGQKTQIVDKKAVAKMWAAKDQENLKEH